MGATGRYGEPVVRHLSQRGFSVRILARDVERDRKRFGDSLEVVQGNATDAESLRSAMRGCTGVHISVSGGAEEPAARNAAAMAAELGLQRISYVSGSATFPKNARFRVIETKLRCEKALIDSGVPYTIFCPAFAMEVLPLHIQGGRASYFGKQPFAFHWLAADDLGRMVASAYATDNAVNKKLFLWGPEGLSIKEALQRYCKVLHPDITKVSSLPFWLAHVIAFAIRDQAMKTAIEVYAMFEGVGGDGGDPIEANGVLGKAEIKLDDWLRSRARKIADHSSQIRTERR